MFGGYAFGSRPFGTFRFVASTGITATGGGALAPLTSSGTIVVIVEAVSSQTLAPIASIGTIGVIVAASASSLLGALTGSALATVLIAAGANQVLGALSSSGTVNVVVPTIVTPTPADRTWFVPNDNRVMLVFSEIRVLVVPADDRVLRIGK